MADEAVLPDEQGGSEDDAGPGEGPGVKTEGKRGEAADHQEVEERETFSAPRDAEPGRD